MLIDGLFENVVRGVMKNKIERDVQRITHFCFLKSLAQCNLQQSNTIAFPGFQ